MLASFFLGVTMSDAQKTGFGQFVPGFDFLQSLTQGAAKNMPQMPPHLAHWVAPTLKAEDIEKRIEELKAVQFWLEQNARALAATIQALEVQKMTLAALKGMNFNLGDMGDAFKPKAAPAAGAAAKPASRSRKPSKAEAVAAGAVDPVQLWGALTQQFQQIAADAMKGMAQQSAAATATGAAKPGPAAKKPAGRSR